MSIRDAEFGELSSAVTREPVEDICALCEDGGCVGVRVPGRETGLVGEVAVEEG